MASSLLSLVNDLFEGLHRIKCKFDHYNEKLEICVIKREYCDSFLEYTNFKDDFIEYKCLSCNKSYQGRLDEKLKERFFNAYKFSDHDSNKFILLLGKGVYPYEYMDDWKNFNEALLPEKEGFYSQLNMEDITDADLRMQKEFAKILK